MYQVTKLNLQDNYVGTHTSTAFETQAEVIDHLSSIPNRDIVANFARNAEQLKSGQAIIVQQGRGVDGFNQVIAVSKNDYKCEMRCVPS